MNSPDQSCAHESKSRPESQYPSVPAAPKPYRRQVQAPERAPALREEHRSRAASHRPRAILRVLPVQIEERNPQHDQGQASADSDSPPPSRAASIFDPRLAPQRLAKAKAGQLAPVAKFPRPVAAPQLPWTYDRQLSSHPASAQQSCKPQAEPSRRKHFR